MLLLSSRTNVTLWSLVLALIVWPEFAFGAAAATTVDVNGGELSGKLEGNVRLLGSVVVPVGQTLSIEPGTVVQVAAYDGKIEVLGSLFIRGTTKERVTITGLVSENNGGSGGRSWEGIVVSGELKGTALDVSGARRCLDGLAGSDIELWDANVWDCGKTLAVANGGTFNNSTFLGGSSVLVTGGILRMTDTIIDMQNDGRAPDCTKFNGGGAILDHVHVTACHCPLHFNSCTDDVIITNSIFDLAAYPAMVARMRGNFKGNHFLKNEGWTLRHVLDIGGNMVVDIGGNYWGGKAPTVGSFNMRQFPGVDNYSTEPFPGVGPRK